MTLAVNQPNLCGRCGAPVQAGAHGCYYCGVSFEGAPAAPAARANPNVDPEVVRLIRANNKIEAIKRYREMTGLGLRESKDAVEAIEAQLRR